MIPRWRLFTKYAAFIIALVSAALVVSGGLSLGLRHGYYADGQVTGGSDETLKGWGVALRVTF